MSAKPAAVRRVAAIDCGTNSIRLLIADVRPGGNLVDVVRTMRVVRLGEGVDATGAFAPAALARTFAAVAEYAGLIAEHGAAEVHMIATSAARDARNREEFRSGVEARLGVSPQVVSGQAEALLSFRGATGSLDGRVPGPYLVVDLGGGSTEIVLGDTVAEQPAGPGPLGSAVPALPAGARVWASHSMDVGCVRMTERHGSDLPAIRRDVRAALADAAALVPWQEARSVIGVAGTVTTVVAASLGLDRYDPLILHGAVIPRAEVTRIAQWFAELAPAELAALPYMHPGRVPVIAAGAAVLDEVLGRIGTDALVASEHDILDGIALAGVPAAAPPLP